MHGHMMELHRPQRTMAQMASGPWPKMVMATRRTPGDCYGGEGSLSADDDEGEGAD